MNALILIAHGSRRAESNREVQALAKQLTNPIFQVQAAFLELAEPSIPQAIDQMIQSGGRRIWILPYFLSAGRHVSIDIPHIIAQCQKDHPEIRIRLLSHLGALPQMADLILSALTPIIQADADQKKQDRQAK